MRIRNKFIIITLGIFMGLHVSCKTARVTREQANENQGMVIREDVIKTPPASVIIPSGSVDSVKYTYLVSFFSPGDGIDAENAEALEVFLAREAAKTQGKISFIRVPWGREGELDFCILVKNLSETERQVFDAGLREIARRSKKVNVYENQKCRFLKSD